MPIIATSADWRAAEPLKPQVKRSCSGILVLVLAFVAPALIGAEAAYALPDPVDDGDFFQPSEAMVDLGQLLFFDKELSGNRNISCATCHHPFADTSDGLSLPVGEGGAGLSVIRDTGSGDGAVVERVPRNSPALFNLGFEEFTRMFHDGRLEQDPSHPSGFISPAGDDLPSGLDSALAAQAMFPVTSATEMAGQAGENDIADMAAAGDLVGIWDALAGRLRNIAEYVDLFMAAFADIDGPADITYVHAANAIAAFEADAYRADQSPFDRYLRGDTRALSAAAKAGMKLFYGPAGCAQCHSGPFQTDHEFHAIAMPQIGPGKGDGPDGHEDFGRERETGDPDDRFAFRTPSLRNVVLTGPWGHAGSYASLRTAVEHHLDPVNALYDYDTSQAVLPSRADLDALDFVLFDQQHAAALAEIADANELYPSELAASDLDDLIEFLHALTDPASIDLRRDVPDHVPSGLPLTD